MIIKAITQLILFALYTVLCFAWFDWKLFILLFIVQAMNNIQIKLVLFENEKKRKKDEIGITLKTLLDKYNKQN